MLGGMLGLGFIAVFCGGGWVIVGVFWGFRVQVLAIPGHRLAFVKDFSENAIALNRISKLTDGFLFTREINISVKVRLFKSNKFYQFS